MDNLKNQVIEEINESIIKKIGEINLNLEVYLVKNDAYEKFIKFIFLNIKKDLISFFSKKIDEIDFNFINKKIDILVKKYLSNLRKQD